MDNRQLENTKRVAKNTLFLYGRMMLGMFVSLYTSRVILNALGVEDYGIYGVVGGLVAMFSLITSSLQASITRYIAFELGRNDKQRLRQTFSSAFAIQIVLAIFVLLLGETVGIWFMNTQMTIPESRLFASNVVYQASLVSFMLGLLLMPYFAIINAHEKMNVYAYTGLLDIFLKLGVVLFVAYAPFSFDRMIVYSLMLVAVGIAVQLVCVIYCQRNFAEVRLNFKFNYGIIKGMAGFAGWNFIGCSSVLLRDQGGNILLNIFFGPILNAARSISGSVSNAICGLTGSFMAAVNPQITKSYASGDKDYMMSLVFRAAKFGFVLMFLTALPVLYNTSYILRLWLVDVPAYSVVFVRLILVFSLVESLSYPLITLQLSTGKIRNYQLVVGGIQSLNFPLSFALLRIGFPPATIFFVAIILGIFCLIARLMMLRAMVGLKFRQYVEEVLVRCLAVVLVCGVLMSVIFILFNKGDFISLIITSFLCIAITIVASYIIVCNSNEQRFILSKVVGFRNKLIA